MPELHPRLEGGEPVVITNAEGGRTTHSVQDLHENPKSDAYLKHHAFAEKLLQWSKS